MKNKEKEKIENWQTGDIFTLKIENSDYPEYIGKYLILIFYKIKDRFCFRAKIAEDKNDLTKAKIEKLDYIKTCIHIKESLDFREEENENLIPDEMGYYYSYLVEIIFSKEFKILPANFEYLDNYKISLPKNEYITDNGIVHAYMSTDPFSNGAEKLIVDRFLTDCYNKYNLKNCKMYDYEVAKKWREQELMIKEDISNFLKSCN